MMIGLSGHSPAAAASHSSVMSREASNKACHNVAKPEGVKPCIYCILAAESSRSHHIGACC